MTNPKHHYCFPQPEDRSTLLWRYLDLSKFAWLIQNESLYLPAASSFSDPFEGAIPKKDMELIEEYRPFRNSHERELRKILRMRLRRCTYISCWRLGNDDSDAMWRLYCGPNNGVAIVSEYGAVEDSLEDPMTFIGAVNYVDYDSYSYNSPNHYCRFMHKRKSFEHEQEVRVISMLYDEMHPKKLVDNVDPPEGITIPFNLKRLVKRIYVHPMADQFYFDVVQRIVADSLPELVERVDWSPMRAIPIY